MARELARQEQWDDFSRFWPLKAATALWLVAVMITYLVVALSTWREWVPTRQLGFTAEARTAIWTYAFASGGIGATLYTIRGFYQAVGPQRVDNPRYHYDPNWTVWYFMRPL